MSDLYRGIPTPWDEWLGTVRQQRVAMVLIGALIGVLAWASPEMLALFLILFMTVVGYSFPAAVKQIGGIKRLGWLTWLLIGLGGITVSVAFGHAFGTYVQESFAFWMGFAGFWFIVGALVEWDASIPDEYYFR